MIFSFSHVWRKMGGETSLFCSYRGKVALFLVVLFGWFLIGLIGFKYRLRNLQKLDIPVYACLVEVKHFLGIVSIVSSFVDDTV